MKIIVTTYPFGEKNNKPKDILCEYDVQYNKVKRKYSREELKKVLEEEQPDIIIAGTEKYDPELLNCCPNLKMISRVGIGLDSLDLKDCKNRNIIVTYTPDAPSNAVAELTICQMINSLRNIQYVNKTWDRYIGKEIRDCNIGIFGCGRIGKLVIEKLQSLKPRRIFVNDIDEKLAKNLPRCEYEDKPQILANSDIVSLHIPLKDPSLTPTYDNHNFITEDDLMIMKDDSIIINTSRGGIINENDLAKWLRKYPSRKAVLDVFEQEPYNGELKGLDNAFLTPHLSSCTTKSRFDMEVGAAQEAINCIKGKRFFNRIV